MITVIRKNVSKSSVKGSGSDKDAKSSQQGGTSDEVDKSSQQGGPSQEGGKSAQAGGSPQEGARKTSRETPEAAFGSAKSKRAKSSLQGGSLPSDDQVAAHGTVSLNALMPKKAAVMRLEAS